MMRTGGQILVDCLIAQDIKTIFGVPGESYLAVLDALYDVKDSLKFINARHEGGAAFMAEAHGKLTGTPGICFVTRGPGATNASIGVHTAMQNSSPMILFIGQVAREQRGREAFQEVDYSAFFKPLAKDAFEITQADRIPEIVSRAFASALSGRPGPVVISVPEDMLCDTTDVKIPAKVKIPTAAPTQTALEEITTILNQAERPILLVGGGGWNDAGRAALEAFARATNIPVIVAFRSQDLFDNTLPNYIGDAGVGMSPHVKDALRNADTLLAINVRFGEMTTDAWSLFDLPKMQQKLIHAHASSAELGKIYQADVSILATPNEMMDALQGIKIKEINPDWARSNRTNYETAIRCSPQPSPVDMGVVCEYLRDHLDDDAIITNGAGNFAIWPSKFLSYRKTQRLLGPQSGAMGAGIPAAIAASTAFPDRQVVCFAGDGDFQMTCQELGTAMQERLKIMILLLNNKTYGTIRMHQERTYPNRVSGTDIVNPDFKSIARAYNFTYEHIENTDAFSNAYQRILKSQSASILELNIATGSLSPSFHVKV